MCAVHEWKCMGDSTFDETFAEKRSELKQCSAAIAPLKVVHSEMTEYTDEFEETLAEHSEGLKQCSAAIASLKVIHSDMTEYTDELQSDLRAAQHAFLDRNTVLDAEYQAKSTELNAEARARQDNIEYWLSQQSHRFADLNVSVPRLRQQVEEACPATVDDDAYATQNEQPAIPPQWDEIHIGDAMFKYEEGMWWKQ